MKSAAEGIIERLRDLGAPEISAHSQRFFKTGPGEYGEGDVFLGIRVPVIRKLTEMFRTSTLDDITELLKSPYHEARLFALLVMVEKFRKAKSAEEQQAIYDSYLASTSRINNWDLVDCSAEHIAGVHLFGRDRSPLYRLSRSKSLWERRIAIMSTFHFVRKGDFEDTLSIARKLLQDREDLIHKAVGWMLREVGKRDIGAERGFLERYGDVMPRTMLRYAIERLPEAERRSYLCRGKR